MRVHIGSVLVCMLLSFARSDTTATVSFWRKNFTMTCPKEGSWYKGFNETVIPNSDPTSLTQEYNDKNKGHYRCQYSEGTYHFYVMGKVCDNCYELESYIVAVGIIADVLLTLGVILVVYVWARKRKSAGAKPKKVSSSGLSGGLATSSSDYETLNPHSRSDPYSTVHRTG